MRRLFLLYSGGTIGMEAGPSGLRPATTIRQTLEAIWQRDALADSALTIAEEAHPIDGGDIQPSDWQRLADRLRHALHHHHAAVLLHGTDSLAYSAAALHWLLRDVKRPLVITGAMRPLGFPATDAEENIRGAWAAAAGLEAGVWVFFHRCLLPALAISKLGRRHRPFVAPAAAVRFNKPLPISHPAPLWRPAQVAVLRLYPGFAAALVLSLLAQGYQGLLLELYGGGTGPSLNRPLLQALAQARRQGMVVAAVSQCFGMSLDLSCYAAGRALQRAGVIGLAGMTSEAAYATLQYFLGIGLRGQRLREHLRPHPLQEEGPPLLL